MGKPTAADLSLGLATAPVLFACEEVLMRKQRPRFMQEHGLKANIIGQFIKF